MRWPSVVRGSRGTGGLMLSSQVAAQHYCGNAPGIPNPHHGPLLRLIATVVAQLSEAEPFRKVLTTARVPAKGTRFGNVARLRHPRAQSSVAGTRCQAPIGNTGRNPFGYHPGARTIYN